MLNLTRKVAIKLDDGKLAAAYLTLPMRQVVTSLEASHAAIAHMTLPMRQVIVWLQAHYDERTIAGAPEAQVTRVVERWRARFRVFRPHSLRAAAAEAGFTPEELRDQALAIGVLKAYAWQAEHWDELGPLPATYVDQLVRTVVLQEADRYLRSVERDTEAVQSSIRMEDLPWMYPPLVAQHPAGEQAAPDTGSSAAAAARWRAILAQAGPAQRPLLEAWHAQPDAPRAEIARALGIRPEAAEQAIRRLRRRLG